MPDTPPVLKAQPDAGKPLSLDPVDRQIRESNRQTERTSPPIPSKAEGPVLSGAEGPMSTQAESTARKHPTALYCPGADAGTGEQSGFENCPGRSEACGHCGQPGRSQVRRPDLRPRKIFPQNSCHPTSRDRHVATDESPLRRVKWTTVLRVDSEQLTQILDIDAGISIPLRTGGKITSVRPFR